ncbi:tumor necrosis factor b (TNF superfamily, member 2) [Esox lucius]|uniref:Tumor necrosis factor n=1 Tax=Esox lucius TaxID=8010 RepID=A0A3P9A6E9_ESOLU|nr:tumor necrosis factor b (TNF superfamily, member 2) [Esox lucius]
MVGYEMTLGDVERCLDNGHVEGGFVYNSTVTPGTDTKASRGWLWKLCVVILVVALCAATALIFAWNQHERMTMDKMVSQMQEPTDARDLHPHLEQIGDKAKAAIHLEGEYSPDNITDALQWRQDEIQTFSQGGFQLQGNKILIPHTGLFFVYSQASFRVKCHHPGNHAITVSHIVWRYSDSIRAKANLLSGLRSICQRNYSDAGSNGGEGWYNSVYVGGVFQLDEGDKLWTETNRLTDVVPEQGKNFFGVFALF